jgi:hypothetical protein
MNLSERNQAAISEVMLKITGSSAHSMARDCAIVAFYSDDKDQARRFANMALDHLRRYRAELDQLLSEADAAGKQEAA